jgi:hypothetical protein
LFPKEVAVNSLQAAIIAASILIPSISQAQVCAPMASGMINWWPADGNPNDLKGYAQGTLMGGTSYTSGQVGQAFTFNGTNAYVSLPSTRQVLGQSTVSIAAWIRPSTPAQGGNVYAEVGSGWTIFGLSWQADGTIGVGFRTDVSAEASSPTSIASTATAPVGVWSFVAATVDVDAKSYKLYINGVEVPATISDHTTKTSFTTATATSCIGVGLYGSTPDGWYRGDIDELQLYYKILSSSDVASIYAAGAAGVCHPPDGPVVPGFAVETYAHVTDPIRLSFSPTGDLYVGRDNSGSGGGQMDAVAIHRILRDGLVVEEYGPAIRDPDGVLFDEHGFISEPGAVLVIHNTTPTTGEVDAIHPDLSVSVALGPSTVFPNSNAMTFDHSGRLLILDEQTHRLLTSTGGTPSLLYDLPSGYAEFVAVDAGNNIYTTELWPDEAHSTVRLHDGAGNLLNGLVVSGLGSYPIAVGPGGPTWGTDLYVIDGDGLLLRVGNGGAITQIGSGFVKRCSDMAFGPDLGLYVSVFEEDRILRIGEQPLLAVADESQIALRFSVVPNPSRGNVAFQMAGARGSTELGVFDLSGRRVWSFLGGKTSKVVWDGIDAAGRLVPPGVYLVRMASGTGSVARRLLIIR